MTDSEEGAEQARKQEIAAQAMDPGVTNAVAVALFWADEGEPVDVQTAYDAIQEQVEAVRRGSLSGVEATLVAQAAALNGMFVDLARRGQASLGRPGTAAERHLRLALKAQNQCRATLDKLADIASRPSKTHDQRPPITRIVREIVYPPIRRSGDGAEGENAKNTRNELIDGAGDEGLDGGAAGGVFHKDPDAETVGAFDRATYG